MALLCHNALLVMAEGPQPGNILIDDDGVIAAILGPEDKPAAAARVDAGGRLVFPGFIDAHVHMRDPGATHKESFASGSAASAIGGVTCVMCMPNTKPMVDSPAGFAAARAAADGQSHVDYALQAAIFPRSLAAAEELWGLGVTSFETLTAEAALDDTFSSAEDLRRLLETVAALDAVVGVYASDRSITEARLARLRDAGRTDFPAFAEGRPALAEAVAIAMVIETAEATGARTVLRQVSTQRGFALAAEAKRRGAPIAVEVTPHHLHLTAQELQRLGAFAQMLPPLRSAEDVAAARRATAEGVVDFVASDHAPHAIEEKLSAPDPWGVPGGTPGLDTIIPAVLDLNARGVIDPRRVAALLCSAPARHFGLDHRKGALKVGLDGDLVIVDPAERRKVTPAHIHSRAARSPFEGHELCGWPVMTILRGKVIAESGGLAEMTLGGQFVARKPGGAAS